MLLLLFHFAVADIMTVMMAALVMVTVVIEMVTIVMTVLVLVLTMLTAAAGLHCSSQTAARRASHYTGISGGLTLTLIS